MTLWRVDVCGVSHRFVEADTKAEAEDAVRQALLDAMDVRATDAGASLTRAYEGAGPHQRKKLLAKLDGLTNPRERQSSRSARRRLEREIKREEAEAEWMAGALRGAPPVSQDVIDLLVRQGEVRHIEVSHLRLHEWERKTPIHGETL
ncbi:MAG TPA: hypothetical protein VN027_05520 [Isoptericola sp.]|nr:hypothetical protein [Isoptericola sp.]